MTTIVAKSVPFAELSEALQSAFQYWDNLRGDRFAPSWNEFELLSLPHQLLPTVLVADCLAGGAEFKFRYYGSGFTKIHGVDLTGQSPLAVPLKNFGEFINDEFLKVFSQKKPNFVVFGYTNVKGFHALQRSVRLPLSDDGLSVSQIVSVVQLPSGYQEVHDEIENLKREQNE